MYAHKKLHNALQKKTDYTRSHLEWHRNTDSSVADSTEGVQNRELANNMTNTDKIHTSRDFDFPYNNGVVVSSLRTPPLLLCLDKGMEWLDCGAAVQRYYEKNSRERRIMYDLMNYCYYCKIIKLFSKRTFLYNENESPSSKCFLMIVGQIQEHDKIDWQTQTYTEHNIYNILFRINAEDNKIKNK